jgi:hypothetical protein
VQAGAFPIGIDVHEFPLTHAKEARDMYER